MSRHLLSRVSGPLLGAISVIAVGVGLSAMVFALADPVLRPLPYARPDRLVSISFGLPIPGSQADPADVPSLTSWQARTDLFDGVAGFTDRGWLSVQLSDRILPLRAVAVTDNLLEVLGLQSRFPEFDPAAAWISSRAAALSGGELGPGQSARIVPEGVLRVRTTLPSSFLFPQANRTTPVDLLLIVPAGPVIEIEGASSRLLNPLARLRPGITPTIVESALNVTMARVGRRVSVVPLSTTLNGRLRGLALGALLAGVLVVVVCWANVFSMSLTRGLYRGSEIATRTALGATAIHIAGLLVREAVTLAVLGSATALAVTWLALRTALLSLPPQFATLGAPSINTRVALFAIVAACVGGVSWCVASVLAWKLGERRQSLHVSSRDGRALRIVRFVLISAQVAAASVLLVGSALLGRSYWNLLSVDSGLDDRTQTLTVIHVPNLTAEMRRDVVQRTLSDLRRVAGVAAVGASEGWLLDGRKNLGGVIIDGHFAVLDRTFVAGDYFEAMGFPFVAGAAPEPGLADTIVINESTARAFFGERNPVGTVVVRGKNLRIVGVVRDIRSRGLTVQPQAGMYEAAQWLGAQPHTTYVLRVVGDSVPVASWERIVLAADPLAIVLDSGDIRLRLDRSIRDRTFATLVVGLFALATLLVAAVGLAGVVAYTVAKRTREIAIRLALGATVDDVRRLVVRDALIAATCGMVGGIIASVSLSRVLESLLYGIHPTDPSTLVLASTGLLGTVLIAAVVPATRAVRISPATALRME
jgi:predicted permease